LCERRGRIIDVPVSVVPSNALIEQLPIRPRSRPYPQASKRRSVTAASITGVTQDQQTLRYHPEIRAALIVNRGGTDHHVILASGAHNDARVVARVRADSTPGRIDRSASRILPEPIGSNPCCARALHWRNRRPRACALWPAFGSVSPE
jgi:hypothetical protein